MTSQTARSLAEPVSACPSTTDCSEVFERLLSEPTLHQIPIVDDGRCISLINRLDFMLVYVRRYGHELYGRRPISALMPRDVVIVDASMPCEEINARFFSNPNRTIVQGFMVEENGQYLGVGSAADLMRIMAEVMTHRASELEDQRRRAEAASESKSQFLASMSHELRTPLNAIIEFADLIRLQLFGPIAPACYHEYVNDIHSSGIHLLHMINDLLDMAKIEAGHFGLHEVTLQPSEISLEVVRMLRQSLETSRVKLDVHVPETLPHLFADEQQIRRILVNLLSNAIKFTPAGGRIILSARELRSGELEIEVSDTGIGIPSDKLEKVLEPFEQIENSFSRTKAGTGLGLPLTKAMIEAHGGKLLLTSELGKGTQIRALFPAARIIRRISSGAA